MPVRTGRSLGRAAAGHLGARAVLGAEAPVVAAVAVRHRLRRQQSGAERGDDSGGCQYGRSGAAAGTA
ncbi:MAG: hypothetical protein ACRDP3_23360, partial [Streptomyces sp.]|uniref:hypothetical protein n=1 Tax=Streptomyces sp. TaxID=1931 RepID=UPI003D6A105E